MTTQVQITKIGDNLMIPLPEDVWRRLKLKDGESVEITTNENEAVLRRSTEDDNEREFREIGKKVFEDYHDVFVALAEGAK